MTGDKQEDNIVHVSDHEVIVNGVKVASVGEGAELKLVLHKNIPDPRVYKVKLSKMSRGYQWEIFCEGATSESVVEQLVAVDKRLAELYGSPEEIS